MEISFALRVHSEFVSGISEAAVNFRSGLAFLPSDHAPASKGSHSQRMLLVIALAVSVRPHNPGDSDRRDGNPTATIRGEKIGSYKNRILTRRLT